MRWIILLLVPLFSSAQSMEEAFISNSQSNGLIGASLVTICGDDVQTYSYGLSHLAENVTMTDSTRYRVASISKLVTAIACMTLVEDGLLDLDTDVTNFLGWELRNPAHPSAIITARMLLSHTSSIIDGSGYSDFIGHTFNQWPPSPLPELLLPGGEDYTSDMFNTTIPGSYFNYTNVGFVTLGTIVEAASQQRFDDYTREHIFEPLGIQGGFNLYELPDYVSLAALYRNDVVQSDDYYANAPTSPDMDLYIPGQSAQFFGPQGSLRVSAEELSRILQALMNEGSYNGIQILSPESVETMRSMAWSYDGTNGNNYFGLFREWGLGVHRTTNTTGEDVVFPGEVMLGHPGEAYGLISDMYWSETVPFGFVWMTNGYHPGFSYDFGTSSTYYSVEEELFQDLKTLAFESCQTALGLEEVLSRATPFYWYAELGAIIVKSEVSIKEIQLMDESGRVVHQIKPNAMESKIDTSALASGIFVISVDTERGRFTQTISTFTQE